MVRSRMVRDHFSRGYWPQERSAMEPSLEEGRYPESQDIRRPPMVSYILSPRLRPTLNHLIVNRPGPTRALQYSGEILFYRYSRT